MTPRQKSNELLRVWCAKVTGDVLSIGSGRDHDHEGKDYRDYFTAARSYKTSEPRSGPKCDLLVDVQKMDLPDDSFDCAFCSGVLEHVRDPWRSVQEVGRVLRPGGVFLLGVPFRQRIHRAPQDFWRFTEHGTRELLASAKFEVKELVPIDNNPANFPSAYWVWAVNRWTADRKKSRRR